MMTPQELVWLLENLSEVGAKEAFTQISEEMNAAFNRGVASEREACAKLVEDGWKTTGPLDLIVALRARSAK